jgi:hypothetical protein
MKAIGPGQYRLISFAAILFTVLAGLFFLIMIPLIAPRNPKFAGVLLIMGITLFALGIFVTTTLLILIFLKTPKK